MRKKLQLAILLSFSWVVTQSQILDNFNDGDFSNNPAWGGNTADWIVNASQQLQSNNTVASTNFYLSTVSTKATTAEWEFYCKLTFNPSGANYVDVFLIASAADITQSTTNGFFVRIGNTDDEISLYRKDGATTTMIIDGTNGILNTSSNTMKIKVVRDAANQWNLYRDLSGTGSSYTSEGVVTDANYSTSAYFGIFVKQSTASFFQKHFIDDIEVRDYVPDVIPPVIVSAIATSSTSLDVLFNEPVSLVNSEDPSHYSVDNGIGFPTLATRDLSNISLVHLFFSNTFPNRTNLQLTVNGVDDLLGNILTNGTSVFSYFTPLPYDVVIDEIMADPTPLVGLPDAEWIELRNTTAFTIDLQGWRVGKPSGQSGPMNSYLLQPDSFVIITTGSAALALSAFGHVEAVTSFPSLNNTGDQLFLRSPQGVTIHSVNYSDTWYQNELKKDGGWSLEMIDTHNPCTGYSNWIASVDPSGGTPGKRNSANATNPDQTAPKLIRAYATDSVSVTLVFDEPLDSVKASLITGYSISDGIGIPLSATPVSPLFDRVNLVLNIAMLHNKVYTVTVSGLKDCSQNAIGTDNIARVGISEHVDSLDVVINEILFNPTPTSNDYVELYNRSSKVLSLRNIYIANRSSTGVISSIAQVSTEDYLFFPGDFIVVTESKALVLHDYVALNPGNIIEISTMPSFSDDKGDVIILNEQGRIVDEVAYLDDWHFKLISNEEGVALERIDYGSPSQQESNWHSAASSVNYGTPTYKNSQSKEGQEVSGTITIDPKVFSPDNDGLDDFATISYEFPEPGYVSNITIFDASGRPVRYLQRNALNGIKGYYRWDGLSEKQQKLPVGMYIIYTEVFNLQGKTKKYKNVIVLARKF